MAESSAESPRVVLVTGASTFIGGYLVARLAANPDIERVLAVDSRVPRKDLLRRMGRAEFLRLDIRRPTIAKALATYDVDTVVHAATSIVDTAPHSSAIKEFNVVSAMQVCAACQRTPSVKRLVLRSTAMVYGASAHDPSHFSEETRARREPKHGYGRDLLDVEGYVRGLGRRRPDIEITIVRPQAMLGPRINTRMSSYLSLPVVPTVIGYQPRLQFLHEEDALAAMEHATLAGKAGTFNIAGEGVVTLTQAIRRIGHIELPVPAGLLAPISGVFQDLRSAKLRSSQTEFLTYGRVLDTTRMRTELGFVPKYTTLETLDDFIERSGVTPVLGADAWRGLEQRVVAAAHQLQ
ncbi:NAD-dependent dehydratase [Gordonia paraffinivorans]|uniref:UDP-glucose 4-epimerase n=1 Tax=Gordonia paraffinivorans TaxID=175628 RepID=A0ABD7V6J0_9ACTN|nr:NAD-dependent epimerase/dehydratase family protein [Gordonia paraffinivorans]MBY4575423.1 NAD-dependent dehydratase [Gordonia paraffinivorans]MCD2145557.1 NAD-dependent epimerase/dehydratase family protein [Gordonia paraffinivorans]VFA89776.1 UDP-glucose 4-epimerase [Gordonia paraffinivorans]